jgi:acyl-CoA synthetase (NDP forming)
MKAALDILLTAPEFDLVLAVVGSSARFHPELAVKPIIDSAGAAKPLAAFLVPDAPQALAALAAAGVPSFHTPEACADAIAASLARRVPVPIAAGPWPVSWRPSMPSAPRVPQGEDRHDKAGYDGARGNDAMLNELDAYALLKRLGIDCAPSIALDADTPAVATLPFSYPAAVKALSAEVAHKSDIGAVVLGVAEADALMAAIARLRANALQHGKSVERVLVQPMVTGVGEVLVGYRLDSEVGPLVMVAAGGLLTEVYRDRSLRLAPVDIAVAHEMIAEVRGLAALSGFRGRPKGDLAALAQAIVAMSQLALMRDPVIVEAEINPLIVRPAGQGAIAVDALVRLLV